MPTLLLVGRYRFCFHSREHEPPHVHVISADAEAVLILGPTRLIRSRGYTRRQEKDIERLVLEGEEDFLRRWHEHFHP